MIKEVALGIAGLGTVGGVGAVSGFFGRPALKWTGLFFETGRDTIYRFQGSDSNDSTSLRCPGKSKEYTTLELKAESTSDWTFKAKVICKNSETKQNLTQKPLEISEISCKTEGSNDFLVKCSVKDTHSKKKPKFTLKGENSHELEITLQ
ncbi:hypothetical protein MHLP_01335 [Candidatus Mycoplasma haematolamae str. Purdue]|uniref:Uncharacterized protein n=1 Tax=Mycoplasma haematolamae (strain Purdue) TaxID=1212765 RepID=I7C5Q5_MYCHA|nr:hypothetical protein [Candidatus Mycoplasma haematolamae]AFO51847.1 hypothetical protein MHLP_01335 [Candidatus Mycoplasma haematolamae str. Purdue]